MIQFWKLELEVGSTAGGGTLRLSLPGPATGSEAESVWYSLRLSLPVSASARVTRIFNVIFNVWYSSGKYSVPSFPEPEPGCPPAGQLERRQGFGDCRTQWLELPTAARVQQLDPAGIQTPQLRELICRSTAIGRRLRLRLSLALDAAGARQAHHNRPTVYEVLLLPL